MNWQDDRSKWSDGDFDATPGVTASDLNVVGLHWQQSAAAADAVPEPATGWMLGSLPLTRDSAGTARRGLRLGYSTLNAPLVPAYANDADR